jgi:hypothetical protein
MSVQKTDSCWLWTESVDKDGYGRIRGGDGHVRAHRYSYALHYGPIPNNLWVLHRCDNPRCVRPDHLFLGTAQDNADDRTNKGRSATGDRNASRKYPNRRPKGITHYNYRNQYAPQRGSGNGRAKLCNEDIRQIRNLSAAGVRGAVIARQYKVSSTTIYDILNGNHWKDV